MALSGTVPTFQDPIDACTIQNYPSLVLDFLSINMKHRSFGCSQAWPHTVCLVLATRAKRIPFGSIFYFMAVRRQLHGTSIVCHSVPGYPSVFWQIYGTWSLHRSFTP